MKSPRLPTAKILIVDDHPLVREGLAAWISMHPPLTVSGQAASEAEALAAISREVPDLAIIDIALQDSDGLELIKQIKSRFPRVRMLVISAYDESLYAVRALRAGAAGYLNKAQSNEQLLDAIQTTLAGERFVSPYVTQRLLDQALGTLDASLQPVDTLTDRELEVFRLIGNGVTTGAIAKQLFLSTHTVDTHRENIKRKLGVQSGAELTRAAVQWVLQQQPN